MTEGRPTKYSEDLSKQAYKLYLLKATDEEVADFFGVCVATLFNWRGEHPEFLEATTRGKTQADAEVAEKLRERALGYSHKAVKIFMPAGAEKPVYAEYTEHYPPDTQAASLWLRNRQPEKWRDKTDHELAGPGGGPIQTKATVDVTGLNDEQLRALSSIAIPPG
jgi:transposase-like protein